MTSGEHYSRNLRRWLAQAALVLLSLMAAGASAQDGQASTAPVGAEARRAYDDLGRLYAGDGGPDLAATFQSLKSSDPAMRRRSGEYLLALARQSFEDEHGRSTYSRQPPGFTEGPVLLAREFRKRLAAEIQARGSVTEAVPAIGWILEHDVLTETRVAAVRALRAIHGIEADRLLVSLVANPRRNGRVLVEALDEIAGRKLTDAAPRIPPLMRHYRDVVRQAAGRTAEALHLTNLPSFQPERDLGEHFGKTLEQIAGLVITPIPRDATFAKFTVTPEASDGTGRAWSFHGWMLGESAGKFHVLNTCAEEFDTPKARTTYTPIALETFAESLVDLRRRAAGGDRGAADALMTMSRDGAFSGQFESWMLRLPEALVAAWAWQRGDRSACTALLEPLMQNVDDERWLFEIPRDLLGSLYDQEMLSRWADYRDFSGALRYAKHLASPSFDGCGHQARAKQLAAQIAARQNVDFVTLTLPTPAQWHAARRSLTRGQQIQFLADRLRLINCRQDGWPTEPDLYAPQRSFPMNASIYHSPDPNRGIEWINPLVELHAMALEPADIPLLTPYLADDNYLLSYHCWRPWASGWHLFRVSEVVSELMDDAAGSRFVAASGYFAASETDRPAAVAALNAKAAMIPSRLARSITAWRYERDSAWELVVAGAALALGMFYLLYRRTRHSVFVASLLFLTAMIGVWYLSLQKERVLLWLDTLPLLLLSAYAAARLWRSLNAPIGVFAGFMMAPIAVVAGIWYGFVIPSHIRPMLVLAVLLLIPPIAWTLRRDRRGWPTATLAFLMLFAAAAFEIYPFEYFRYAGLGVTPERVQYWAWMHAVLAAGLLLTMLALARFVRLRTFTPAPLRRPA